MQAEADHVSQDFDGMLLLQLELKLPGNMQGPPWKPALRVLASKFLKRTIQVGSHDSKIDAQTTMDLAQLKIKHGPAYGARQEAGLDSNCDRLMEVLSDFKRRCVLVDRKDVLSRHVTGETPTQVESETALLSEA